MYTLVSLATSHGKGAKVDTSWEYYCLVFIPEFEVLELLTERVELGSL